MKFSYIIFLFWILCFSTKSYAEITTKRITFDPAPLLNGSKHVTNYEENRYFFSTPNGMGHYNEQSNFAPNNGTAYLNFGVYNKPLKITRIGENPPVFSLIQVDLAHYSLYFYFDIIEFKGIRSDGSEISQSFSLTSGIIFRTFSFNPGFKDLKSVEVNSSGFAMDNIVISANEPPLPSILLPPTILHYLLK